MSAIPKSTAEEPFPISDYDRANIGNIVGGHGDWFSAKLIRLIAKADMNQRERIAKVYPLHVEAFNAWQCGPQTPSHFEPKNQRQLFSLGRIVVTDGVMRLGITQTAKDEGFAFLGRHARGDWGDVDAEDRKTNDDAVKYGARILSVYTTKSGTKIWIITEADRSATTILLPDEY